MHTARLPLLERDRDVATLGELIQQASTGRGAVCVVEGPPGIGKTRMLAEARARAGEHGLTVLSATASELEHEFAFGVVAQLFEPALRGQEALLDGAAAGAGVVVGRGVDSAPSASPSFAALHGLYWLTVRLGEQNPVVLVVDDLHWCDPSSLRFLAYLRTRIEGLPVLVVGSMRRVGAEVDPAVWDAVVDDPATIRVRPRALTQSAASSLLEQRLGSPADQEFAAACHEATGGNPLLLEELTKVLQAEGASPDAGHLALLEELGPTAVPRTLFLRMRRLGGDATAVAQALAVLGHGADLAVLAAVANLDLARTGEATAALAAAEIVRAEPPLSFIHPLVADAVYRAVLAGERALLHLRAAEALAAAGAAVEQVAGHLLHAPAQDAPWVTDRLEQAAAQAARKGATESAVTYLRRALVEPPPAGRAVAVLRSLGLAEVLIDGPAAIEHLRACHAGLTDPVERAVIAQPLARALHMTGAAREAIQVLRAAATELPAGFDDTRDQLLAYEVFCGLFGADGAEAAVRLEPYRTRTLGAGLGGRMLAAMAAQSWMYACGPSSAVTELSLATLADGLLVAEDAAWATTFSIANLSYAESAAAEKWWEFAAAEAHRSGSLRSITALFVSRGNILRRRGELVDAEQMLRDCRTTQRHWGFARWVELFADAHLTSVLRDRGDLAAARTALGAGPDPGRNDEGARLWYASELELLVAEGSYAAAVSAADAYAERFDHIVRNPVDAPWRSLQAVALDKLGRTGQALELVTSELELAHAWGAPATVGRTLRTLGTIQGRDGFEALEAAVAELATSPARLEYAMSLLALGTADRRWRRPSAARVHLRTALDIAVTCGAEAVAHGARSELYASGGRPRRTALTGPASLTASEHRVVMLAGAGRTNREVGESLFITPKTVAMHLSNAYRKLGVSSRHELEAALADR